MSALEQFESETNRGNSAAPDSVPPEAVETRIVETQSDLRVPPAPHDPPPTRSEEVEDFVPLHVAPPPGEEPTLGLQLRPEDSAELTLPDLAEAPPPGRSRPARRAGALVIGVVLGFAAWYSLWSLVHRTPVTTSAPAALSLASLSPAIDTPAAPARETVVASEPARAAPEQVTEPQVRTAPPSPQAAPPPSGDAANLAVPADGRAAEPPAVPSADGSTPGRMLVRSTPSGARVFVDDQEYGVTPATIRDLPVRTHQVRVALDGYAGQEQRIALTAARPAQSVVFDLEQPRASASGLDRRSTPSTPGTTGTMVGALRIESHPEGASVFLDGQLVGQTPLSLSQVETGPHVIRLELDLHRGWSSPVRVVSGTNRVTASLEDEEVAQALEREAAAGRRDGRDHLTGEPK